MIAAAGLRETPEADDRADIERALGAARQALQLRSLEPTPPARAAAGS